MALIDELSFSISTNFFMALSVIGLTLSHLTIFGLGVGITLSLPTNYVLAEGIGLTLVLSFSFVTKCVVAEGT